MKRITFFVIICLLIIFQIRYVYAYDVRRPLKALVNGSPLIIVGEVNDTSPEIEKRGEKERIYTYVTIQVESTLKGDAKSQSVIIKIIGGKIGDRIQSSEMSFHFSIGDEVLLFLHPLNRKKNIYTIESISGQLKTSMKDAEKFLDCSMLGEDEVSKYGKNTLYKQSEIISRIRSYLSKAGGNQHEYE